MKSLREYLSEMEGAATPGNTMGMGNPVVPNGNNVGSEPIIPTAKTKKEKKNDSKSSIRKI